MKWQGKKVKPSARLAVLLTLTLFPGAGQALNRQWGKAVAVGTVSAFALVMFLFFFFRGIYLTYTGATELGELPSPVPLFKPMLTPFLGLLAMYAGASWDAWVVGRRLEARSSAEEEAEEAESPAP